VETDTIFDDAAALHPAHDVLDTDPAAREGLIGGFLFLGEFSTTRLLDGLKHVDPIKGEGQKAEVLQQLTALGQLVVGKIGDGFVGSAALLGTTEEEDDERGVYEKEVFDRVEAFLATEVALLLSGSKGARDGPFRGVVGKRGGTGSSTELVSPDCSVTASKRASTAAKSRPGASPIARSAVRSTGNRVWIQ
jgi:hypothetical protein